MIKICNHRWKNSEPLELPDGQKWPVKQCVLCGKYQWLVPANQGEKPAWEDLP